MSATQKFSDKSIDLEGGDVEVERCWEGHSSPGHRLVIVEDVWLCNSVTLPSPAV